MITLYCSITSQNKILNHTAVNISTLNVTYPYCESYMRDTRITKEQKKQTPVGTVILSIFHVLLWKHFHIFMYCFGNIFIFS